MAYVHNVVIRMRAPILDYQNGTVQGVWLKRILLLVNKDCHINSAGI